jgi:hypothetical protein
LDLAKTPKVWEPLANLPVPIAYTALAYVPAVDKLFAVGGELGAGGISGRVMVYESSTGQWRWSGIDRICFNRKILLIRKQIFFLQK